MKKTKHQNFKEIFKTITPDTVVRIAVTDEEDCYLSKTPVSDFVQTLHYAIYLYSHKFEEEGDEVYSKCKFNDNRVCPFGTDETICGFAMGKDSRGNPTYYINQFVECPKLKKHNRKTHGT